VHAGADASLVEKIYGDLFDDAGTDAAEHVFAGLPFQDDVIDAVLVQELAEQQSRWAGADDGDLGSHAVVISLTGTARNIDSNQRRFLIGR
jgi:hypothetical protein